MALSIRLLGTLDADIDGRPIDLGGPRQRSVLALLLVARGEVVSVDRLIDDLWRGEPPPRAMGALQAYVSNLRRALEPDRAPRTAAQHLISAAPGYAVRFAGSAVDAWQFEDLVRAARDAGSPVQALSILEQALALWRGDALAEFAVEPWAAPEAARLDELRLVARERLVDAQIHAGRAAEAVVSAETLIRDVPLREEGWRLLALSQYLGGRQGDALATLRRARQLLSDELGIDPGPRLAGLERDVLAQSVELAPVSAPAAAVVAEAPAAPVTPTQQRPAGGFVGRARELAALRAAAETARPGAPAIALVAGEAGGGKSALLGRLRDELRAGGWRISIGRCPEDEAGPPARAWAEAVRDLAAEQPPGPYAEALAPLLGDELVPELEPGGLIRRFQLHRAVRDWISSLDDRPLVIFLDDVHRADAETRTLLAGLLDQGLANRVLFVLAYRPETGEGLDDLLATLARYAPTRVRLAGLAEDEVAALIETVTGAAADSTVVRALAERTDGNPFYLKESARLLVSEGELVATSQVPEGVADVLRRRLARLPAESVSLLRLASVIGRNVDVALLVRAAEVGEDAVLDALETGLISGLLLEPGAGSVRFSHLLVRETLYAGVPQLRRVRWHARIAEAVAELYPSDLTALAYHSARSATAATAAEAARRCVAAAELARARFAYDSEAELYLEAERCLRLQPDADPAELVDVLAHRVRALIWAGGTTLAAKVRDEAVRIAVPTDDTELIAKAVTCGTTPSLRGTMRSYGQKDDDFIATIERLLQRPLSPRTRSRVLTTLVRETNTVGDPRTSPSFDEALRLAQEVNDPELIGMALGAIVDEYPADIEPERNSFVTEKMLELGAANKDLPAFEVAGHLLACNRAKLDLDLAEAHRQVDMVRMLSRRYQLPQGLFVADVEAALLTHLEGDADAAEQLYVAAMGTQLTRGTVDAEAALLLVMSTVRYTQGRLGELVPALERAYGVGIEALGHIYAFALAESGDIERARTVAARTPPLLRDYLYVLIATMRALTLAAVGETTESAQLYEALLPHAGQIAGAATVGFVLGPVAQALGQLAAALGRPTDAQRHFAQAREIALRCGNDAWAQRAERYLSAAHENAGA
jgi:DNA-binding SARP family transcriptional activator